MNVSKLSMMIRRIYICLSLVLILFNDTSVAQTGGVSAAPLEYKLIEEEPAGTRIGDVAADAGITNINDNMKFSFSHQTQGLYRDYLNLDTSSGRPILYTTQSINREKICAQMLLCDMQFNIMVQPIEYFQIIKVLLHIEDRNDNEPTFPQESLTTAISESAMPGTTFAIPTADDLDSGINAIKTYILQPQQGK